MKERGVEGYCEWEKKAPENGNHQNKAWRYSGRAIIINLDAAKRVVCTRKGQ